MTKSPKTVIVIGGGVAGLATASLLSGRGFRVTLVEQKSRLGGRTFSFRDHKTSDVIDNGQHILMGCYQYTLRWLDLLEQTHLVRADNSIVIPFVEPYKKLYPLIVPNLPMPLHLIAGILSFKNLSFKERLLLLWAGLKLPFQHIQDTLTADNWLSPSGQNENTKKYFWNPVCLAVMNESLKEASAKVFAAALKQMFLVRRDYSKIMIPKVGLTELFVIPSAALIRQNSGNILLNHEVESMHVENAHISEIRLTDKRVLTADLYISAVPQAVFIKTIGAQSRSVHLKDLNVLKNSPIVSVYLWLEGLQTGQLFDGMVIGCIGTQIQWIFAKSDHLLEVTISGALNIIGWDRAKIVDLIIKEIKSLFANFDESKVRYYQVIKERSATFSNRPGSEKERLASATPINNLFLAGDWTDTGLPSTIESAVKSAYSAVDYICSKYAG